MPLDKIVRSFEHVIEHLPHYCSILDLNSIHCITNKRTAAAMGFNNTEKIIGQPYGYINCPAVEQAEQFVAQDQKVIDSRRELDYLCYHHYTDGWKIVYGTRKPLMNDENDVCGLIYLSQDIQEHKIINLSRFLMDSNAKVFGLKQKQFTMHLIEKDIHDEYRLTRRQLECLFFVIRGKTAKEISSRLKISPKTVESYIAEIKIIFSCYSISQLVEKSINCGYFNIIPSTLFN